MRCSIRRTRKSTKSCPWMVIVVCVRVVDRLCGTTLAKVRLRLEPSGRRDRGDGTPHSSTGRAVGGITALKLPYTVASDGEACGQGVEFGRFRDRQRPEFLGTAETLLDDASRLAERARKAGVAGVSTVHSAG